MSVPSQPSCTMHYVGYFRQYFLSNYYYFFSFFWTKVEWQVMLVHTQCTNCELDGGMSHWHHSMSSYIYIIAIYFKLFSIWISFALHSFFMMYCNNPIQALNISGTQLFELCTCIMCIVQYKKIQRHD